MMLATVRIVVLAELAFLAGLALSVVVMALVLVRAKILPKFPLFVGALAGSAIVFVISAAFGIFERLSFETPLVWYGTPLVALAGAAGIVGAIDLLGDAGHRLRDRMEVQGVVTHEERDVLLKERDIAWGVFDERLTLLEAKVFDIPVKNEAEG